MNWKDFFQTRFETLCLLFLVLVFIVSHSAMVHWNRPTEMIRWEEGLTEGIIGGLLLNLKK